MIRGILVFLIVWVLVGSAIFAWQGLTSKEKWGTIKVLSWSGATAFVAAVLLTVFVLLF